MSNENLLKFTIIGDGLVGKTFPVETYINNEFPEISDPTVFKYHNCIKTIDGKEYNMTFCDTGGSDCFDRLRRFLYSKTCCFLLCYSVDSRPSFEAINIYWLPEIHSYSKKVPIILIGTKLDLRRENCEEHVTTEEGQRLKEEIHAHSFVECSAKEKINLQKVVEDAIRAVEMESKSKTKCRIL